MNLQVLPAERGIEYRANSGGPMSRRRTERLQASLLGVADGHYGCPAVLTVAIDFGRADPITAARRLMRRAKITDPEALRPRFQRIDEPCLCRTTPRVERLHYRRGPLEELLQLILILGLSTGYLYDPARPVLLTTASLTRRLTLYNGEGYYA